MMRLTVVQMGQLEVRALLEACSIYGVIWMSIHVSSMCICTYTSFWMLENWSMQFT